jgi:3-hydroxyisobutyrate dehydrogenase
MSDSNVAVIGLGLMGSGMALNLLRGGFAVSVFNRSPEKAAPAVAAGARLAESPRDAASGAGIVISMVADDRASREVWLGPGGALAGVAPGALLIESSTVSVDWVRELAAAATGAGAELLDAPVTGSRDQAASGQVLFLAGGSAAAVERARPILGAMGRGLVHVGPTGSGALLKLVNNFMSGAQAAVLAEAVAFVERSGLDTSTAFELLTNGAPGSPLVKAVLPRMAASDYTPYFLLRLMAKDLTYARAHAERVGLTLSTATAALGLYERAIADGHADHDFSAVIEPLRTR